MEIYYTVLVFIWGLLLGSFLNCLIWRWYKNESLGGRSYCPHCRKKIVWYDNIPVLSFLLLGGRCRQCQVKISWQYPLVELATAVLLVLTWQHDLASPQLFWLLWRDWLVIITLLIVFVYDFRWQLVPVSALWWLGGLVALINLVLGYSPISLLLYAVVGGGFFLLQYLLTNKRGVGEGDIWLGVFLGLVFPSAGESFLALLIAYIIGAVVGLSLVWSKHKDFQSRIALGPFLAIGAIITLIWGQMIIDWYLSLF